MTSAIALLLILLGAFAMMVAGHATCRSVSERDHGLEPAESTETFGVAVFSLGLVLLLAGWWLA